MIEIHASHHDSIASTLRAAWQSSGASIDTIAEALGVDRSLVSHIASGRRRSVTPSRLSAWARACGCTCGMRLGESVVSDAGNLAALRFALDASRSAAGLHVAVPDSTDIDDLPTLVRLCDVVDVQVWIVWGDA